MSGYIHYISTRKHAYTLGIFAALHGGAVASFIRILPYAMLPRIRAFRPGPVVFADLDRIPAAARTLHAALADALAADGHAVLNHPRQALGRFALLRRLHESGINDFTVHRLSDWREVRRFPVFIRHENVHGRAVTGLLPDLSWLRDALAGLSDSDPAALAEMMIVEFGNVTGADGRYRKYGAFRVGSQIYAQHCYSSDDWWVKFNSATFTPEQRREHDDYAAANPHRAQLGRVFEAANIEYGRADYCLVDGRVQVFEINTNPSVIHGHFPRAVDGTVYIRSHRAALERLLAEAAGGAETPNPLYSEDNKAVSADAVHDALMQHIRERWEPVLAAELAARDWGSGEQAAHRSD
ncbi:MAG TPA: hypothetical protein VJV39_13700 [Dongiaceae bacterium]|nr:hypothetical protein [Dongiaceae bacterium]